MVVLLLLQLRAAWTVLSRVPMEATGVGQLLFLTVVALSWGLHHEEKATTQALSGCDRGPHTLPLDSASGTLGPLGLWLLHLGGPAMVSGWFLGFASPCPSPSTPPLPLPLPPPSSFKPLPEGGEAGGDESAPSTAFINRRLPSPETLDTGPWFRLAASALACAGAGRPCLPGMCGTRGWAPSSLVTTEP